MSFGVTGTNTEFGRQAAVLASVVDLVQYWRCRSWLPLARESLPVITVTTVVRLASFTT